jgi:hypothetical protein
LIVISVIRRLPVSRNAMKHLISILMESPLYLTLPVSERRSLVTNLVESYPFLVDDDEGEEVGYESSWAGIVHTQR